MTKANPVDPADTPTGATEPTTPSSPAPSGESPPASLEDTPGDGEPRGGNPEAAKYRVRLRETEAERDALTARLAAAEQAVIDHATATAGIDPRLWQVSDVDLDAMRTETGTLDVAAVIARAKKIRQEIYGVARPVPTEGMPFRPTVGLAEVFNPNRYH